MRLLFLVLSFCLLTGCSYWRQRNIAVYESKLAAEEKQQLPPEPKLGKKGEDDVSDDSLLTRDGLTPAERAIIDYDRARSEAARKERSDKIFHFWTPDNRK